MVINSRRKVSSYGMQSRFSCAGILARAMLWERWVHAEYQIQLDASQMGQRPDSPVIHDFIIMIHD